MPVLREQEAVSNDLRDEVFKLFEDGKLSDGDVKSDKEVRAACRHLAKSSLYFLCKGVLGYKDMTVHTHMDMCRFIQSRSHKRKILLVPRGCFKSTIGSKGYPIQCVLNDPNDRILIANQIVENAEEFLEEIEMHFDGTNQMMNWLFPRWIKPGDRFKPWNSRRMKCPNADQITGTATIQTLGRGARAESKHFFRFIKDDMIGLEDLESFTNMQAAIIWDDFSDALFVNVSEGEELVLGTRWSLDDYYSVKLADPKYARMIRQAIDPETGELFFPERITREFLEDLREKNFLAYMSQYMNDPTNPAQLELNSEWLRYYSLEKIRDDTGFEEPYCVYKGESYRVAEMDVIIVIDPAGSGDVETKLAEMAKRGRAQKSNNAVEVWGRHPSGNNFLLGMWAGRKEGDNPELQLAEEVLKLVKEWWGYLRQGYIEAYGAEGAIITVFNMLCQQEGVHFRIDPLPKSIQKAKVVRIRSWLGPPAQNGQIYVRKGHDLFVHEFTKFGSTNMMDTIDCGAWAQYALVEMPTPTQMRVSKAKRERRRRKRIRVLARDGY